MRNACFSSADYLVTPLLWVITTPLLIAGLGKEQYGLWMLVNSVIGMGGVVSFGLTDATIKYVAKYRAQQDAGAVGRVVRTTLTLYLLLGLLAGGCLCAVAPLLAHRVFKVSAELGGVATAAFRLAGAGVLVRFLYSIFQSVFYGFERYDVAARIGMAVNVVTMSANVLLVMAGRGLCEILGSTIAILLTAGFVQAWVLRRRVEPSLRLWPWLDRSVIREVAGFGLYTWFQSLTSMIMQNMDVFLIGAIVNPAAVTLYSVSCKIPLQVHGLLTRAFAFLFPFSGGLVERGDRVRFKRVYDKAMVAVTVLASAMIVPIYLFGHNFLHLWMGPDFARASRGILEVLCLRFALLPIGIVCYHCMLGAGLVRVQALVAILSALLNLGGMLLLIPKAGPLGAALGLLFSLPLMLLTFLYINRKLFGRADLRGGLAYVMPVLGLFGLATWPVAGGLLPLLSWPGLAAAAALSAGVVGLLTWLVTNRVRRLGRATGGGGEAAD